MREEASCVFWSLITTVTLSPIHGPDTCACRLGICSSELLAIKMLSLSRLFHLAKYLVVVLVLVYCVFPYLRSHSPAYVRDRYQDLLSTSQDEKKLFVEEFLKKEVGGDLDGSALEKLCASKTWFPESEGIVLSCEPVPGGVGEVRAGLLNCIRFAIEIGGAYSKEIILPPFYTIY